MADRELLKIRPVTGRLSWLTDCGAGLADDVRTIMLGHLLASPGVVVMGAINGLIVNMAAIMLCYHPIFVVLSVLNVAIGAFRYITMNRAAVGARKQQTSIEPTIYGPIVWGVLQGALGMAGMMSGNRTVQVLTSIMIFAALGPVCSRLYYAPRLACLVVGLCDLPFVLGGCLSGDPWFYVLIPMTPPFLYATFHTIGASNAMAVKLLTSEINSEREARRDPLTGLSNRLEYAEKLASMAADQSRPLVMFCLDLDGFKQINDTLGHPVGDALLQAVATRLQRCVRRDNALFRMGGDEFVIIAQGLPSEMAPAMAGRILTAICSEPFAFEGQPAFSIGVSVGFACSPPNDPTRDELYTRADLALYSSKAAGKGVYRAFDPEQQAA